MRRNSLQLFSSSRPCIVLLIIFVITVITITMNIIIINRRTTETAITGMIFMLMMMVMITIVVVIMIIVIIIIIIIIIMIIMIIVITLNDVIAHRSINRFSFPAALRLLFFALLKCFCLFFACFSFFSTQSSIAVMVQHYNHLPNDSLTNSQTTTHIYHLHTFVFMFGY